MQTFRFSFFVNWSIVFGSSE